MDFLLSHSPLGLKITMSTTKIFHLQLRRILFNPAKFEFKSFTERKCDNVVSIFNVDETGSSSVLKTHG